MRCIFICVIELNAEEINSREKEVTTHVGEKHYAVDMFLFRLFQLILKNMTKRISR